MSRRKIQQGGSERRKVPVREVLLRHEKTEDVTWGLLVCREKRARRRRKSREEERAHGGERTRGPTQAVEERKAKEKETTRGQRDGPWRRQIFRASLIRGKEKKGSKKKVGAKKQRNRGTKTTDSTLTKKRKGHEKVKEKRATKREGDVPFVLAVGCWAPATATLWTNKYEIF